MTRARDLAAGTFELATGGVLKLETSDTTVTDGSVLGKIEFKAPDEASGTDAILVGAAIEAVAEGTFAADNNATELVFKTGASAAADAKMILDSSGNLLVGKTSENTTTVGIQARADGLFSAVKASAESAIFGRNTDDGNIVNFRKDGSSVGSIGTSGGRVYLADDATNGITFSSSSAIMWPSNSSGGVVDNTMDIGSSSYRFKDLYLSGGVFLGGTGSANKLSDYESGTWTPTGSSITFAEQVGLYVKIGNVVHVGARVVFPTTSDGGAAKITGLPFTSTNSSAARAGITISWHDEGSSNGLAFLVTNNSTEGIFYLGNSSKTNANMSGNTAYLGGTYLSG